MSELGTDLYIHQLWLERFKCQCNKFLKDLEKHTDSQESMSVKLKEYDNMERLQDASE